MFEMHFMKLWYLISLVSFMGIRCHASRETSESRVTAGQTETSVGNTHYGAEMELYDHLFRHYNKNSRPRKIPSEPVNVTVSLTLSQIVDVNEKHQTLVSRMWFWLKWTDDFLSWNRTDYPNITYLIVPSDKLWVPDVFVPNLLGNTKCLIEDFFGRSEGAEVLPSGDVSLWVPLLLHTFCQINIYLFPFDTQSCAIPLNSWIHDIQQLRIIPDAVLMHFEKPKKSSISKKWILKSYNGSITQIDIYGYIGRYYDQLIVDLVLKRKSTFYVVNLLFPCYMITIISCLSLLLPPEAGADRINLLLTTFLAILVFVLVVLEIVPEESDTLPMFSKLLLFAMVLNFLMMIYSTISSGIFNGHGCRWEPPKCLKAMTKAANRYEEAELEDQHCNNILDASDNDDAALKMKRRHKIQFEIKKRYLRQWKVIVGVIDKVLFVVCLVVLTSGFLGITFVLGE